MADENLDFDGEEQPTPPPEPRNLKRTPTSVSQAVLMKGEIEEQVVGSVACQGRHLAISNRAGDVVAETDLAEATATLPGVMSALDKATLDALAARPWPEAPLNLKGIAASVSELPASGNKSGDMYIVGTSSPFEEYFWTGSAWEMLGMFPAEVDTSGFVLKSDILTDDEAVREVLGNG